MKMEKLQIITRAESHCLTSWNNLEGKTLGKLQENFSSSCWKHFCRMLHKYLVTRSKITVEDEENNLIRGYFLKRKVILISLNARLRLSQIRDYRKLLFEYFSKRQARDKLLHVSANIGKKLLRENRVNLLSLLITFLWVIFIKLSFHFRQRFDINLPVVG